MGLTLGLTLAVFLLVVLVLVSMLLFVKAKLSPSGKITIDINDGEKILEVDGFKITFKAYLKSNCFSYRYANYHTLKCQFLVIIPVNSSNYNQDTMACIGLVGIKQTSSQGHPLVVSNKKLIWQKQQSFKSIR